MPEIPNKQKSGPDRHRQWQPLSLVLLVVLAAALIVNVVVVDASQVGFLIPIFVIVWIAMSYENRGDACGRRHAK